VNPTLASQNATTTPVHGAGLMTYATYDLTNHATLKSWSTLLTVTDLGWGNGSFRFGLVGRLARGQRICRS
jgi:uncharacterized membrane protein